MKNRRPSMKVEHLVTQAQARQVCEVLGLDPNKVLAVTITAGGYEAEVLSDDDSEAGEFLTD